jgi:uncharacterized membrane protein (UPF0127 family)
MLSPIPDPARPTVAVRLERHGGALVATAEVPSTRASRRRGLLGRDGLAPGRAMLLAPCSSVHTFFMRFAIDVVFLDREGCVVHVVHRMRPGRMAWGGWRARQTLEMEAGRAAAIGLQPRDRLVIG